MKNFFISILFWMLLHIQPLSAESFTPSSTPYERQIAWSKVAWDQDKPYHQARQEIDAQIKRGVSAAVLAQKFEQPMQLNDTLIQFRWAYASYEAARKNNFSGRTLQTIKERLQFGSEQKPPHSAEFARLMFLTYSRFGPWANLADAGQRLVKRFPNDFEIKWFALQSLSPGRNPKHFVTALSYVRDLKKRQPNKLGANLLIPDIYVKVWYVKQTKQDGVRASNAFKAFLIKAPKNDPGRSYAQSQINLIKNVQPILDKKKAKLAASKS